MAMINGEIMLLIDNNYIICLIIKMMKEVLKNNN